MLPVIPEDEPWYSQGLPFKCTECGQCCTGAPGYIWVTEKEIQTIASYLNLSLEEFSRLYLRRVKGRFSLLEKPNNYDCIFLKDKKCQIYPVRPTQCRTFPWWPQNLKSKKEWEEAAKFCEGIQQDAPLVPCHEIKEQLTKQENYLKDFL